MRIEEECMCSRRSDVARYWRVLVAKAGSQNSRAGKIWSWINVATSVGQRNHSSAT